MLQGQRRSSFTEMVWSVVKPVGNSCYGRRDPGVRRRKGASLLLKNWDRSLVVMRVSANSLTSVEGRHQRLTILCLIRRHTRSICVIVLNPGPFASVHRRQRNKNTKRTQETHETASHSSLAIVRYLRLKQSFLPVWLERREHFLLRLRKGG